MTGESETDDQTGACDTEFDVVGLGTILVDHQIVLREFPSPDSKVEVLSHRQQVGGPVPTALVLLQRFGNRCAFIGKWASDAPGGFIADDLSTEGVHAGHCLDADGSTGFAHVWIDKTTGSRTVVAWRGDFDPISPTELPSPFPKCKILHLDGWSGSAAMAAAEQARKQNARVFLDTGSPKPNIESLIPLVDVLSCPERFLSQFEPTSTCADHKSAAQRLQQMGPSTVIITKGDRGALCLDPEAHVLEQAAFPITPIDTTGAGDVFCGALVHGLIESWAIDRTLEFAAATAALKCSGMGNRAALPSLQQVEARIRR